MKFRIGEIEVQEDAPFKNDALKRQPVVEFLRDLIKQLEGPFVLALDSPWGTGKTTVVRMLRASLKKEDVSSVYFNAWKEDYVSDPLIPMVAAIDELQVEDTEAGKQFSERMAAVRSVASKVAKRGVVAAVKVATMNAVDLDEVTKDVLNSTAGDVVDDVIESFKQEKASLERFRDALEKAVTAVGPAEGSKPLVFFIDELDRCRPTFAIELLERVKHLFDVKHIVFVLSIDKKQLEAITKAVYGESIDAPEYLRRFIDLDFSLPTIHNKDYIGHLVRRYGFTDFFSARKKYHELASDEESFIRGFTLLSNVYQLPLRSIERCFTRVASVLVQTEENQYIDPIFLAYLVVLRAKRPNDFSGLLEGRLAPADAMLEVKSYVERKGDSDRVPLVLEAYLLAGYPNEKRKEELLGALSALAHNEPDTVQGRAAAELLEIRKHVPVGSFRRDFSYVSLAKKVDISIQTNQRWDE
jgi:molybdopterin-guanine dinucleotide biosynthesis protein